jgi:hypothetical protein
MKLRSPPEPAVVLPPGTPAWITLALVQQTIRTWQPFYDSPLTLEDAVGILANMGRLFKVLSKES